MFKIPEFSKINLTFFFHKDNYSHPVFCNKFVCFIKEGHKLGKIEPLFKRISEADVKVWKEKFGGVQNPTGDAGAAVADTKGKGDKKQAKEKKPPREKKPVVASDASAVASVISPQADVKKD